MTLSFLRKAPSYRLAFQYLKHPMRLILQKLLLPFMHLWLCWSSSVHVHAAHDSLKPGDTLKSSSPLLYSKSSKYFLQFYPFIIPD